MAVNRITGKAGSMKYGSNILPITSWSVTITRELARLCDSSDFDAVTKLMYPVFIPVFCEIEVELEGNFDTTATTGTEDALVDLIYASAAAAVMELRLDETKLWGSGSSQFSEFGTEEPVGEADPVTWSGTAMATGKWTIGGTVV